MGINRIELEKKLTDDIIIKLYSLWDIYHMQDLGWVYEDVFNVEGTV